MAENKGIQRLFGGCGCGFEDIIPLIIIAVALLFGEELIDFIDCNEELTLIFIVILLILLFM